MVPGVHFCILPFQFGNAMHELVCRFLVRIRRCLLCIRLTRLQLLHPGRPPVDSRLLSLLVRANRILVHCRSLVQFRFHCAMIRPTLRRHLFNIGLMRKLGSPQLSL